MERVQEILAIVPARSGSKGLPKKNIRLLKGKPLLAYPILAARASKYISRVICSTDDDQIARLALNFGAEVPRLRPKTLATDDSSVIDVIIDILLNDDTVSEVVVLLEPTSPLTTASDIDRGIEAFLGAENAPSLISVSPLVAGHPQYTFRLLPNGALESPLGNQWQFKRRQEISELYFQDGSLYISSRKNMLERKTFFTSGTLGMIMPKAKSFEIDDEIDWRIIETLILENPKA